MKKLYVILMLLLLILFAMYGYFKGWDTYITKPSLNPSIRPYVREIESLQRYVEDPKNTNLEKEKRIEKLVEKLPNKLQRWFQLGLKSDNDIDFYGRLVDQNGEAISGAKVHYSFIGQFLSSGSGSGYRVTDNQGYFNLQGKGGGLAVHWFSHPSIYYEAPAVKDSERGTGKLVQNYREFNTSEKPKKFTAWRQEIYQNVRKSNGAFNMLANGTVYTLDLENIPTREDKRRRKGKGKTVEYGMMVSKGANGDGQLHVSCMRAAKIDAHEELDWSFTITPFGGGIQHANDRYLNHAPAIGYLPSFTIDQRVDSPTYRRNLHHQEFYFKTIQGKRTLYGSLIVSISDVGRTIKDCRLNLDFKINLEGNRNLAVEGLRRSY